MLHEGGRGPAHAGAIIVAGMCVIFVAASSGAQERLTEHTWRRSSSASGPRAQVQDMAWLAGHWTGEALGGTVDEIWSPPRGGEMMGMFRLVKDGETAFYELMTIVGEEGSLVLRLKHFGTDLASWEEKEETVDFPLVAIADGTFRFEGLSFYPEGDDHLRIHLAMRGKEGTVREETFTYTRAPAPGREP